MAENSKYCGSPAVENWKLKNMRTGFFIMGVIVWKMTHVNKNIS